MVLLTINTDILKKNHSEFLQTLISVGKEVRKLPGCTSYQILQNLEADDSISLELEWDSHDAMRSYVDSRNFSIIMGAIKTFCMAPQIKIGQLVQVEHQNLIDKNY